MFNPINAVNSCPSSTSEKYGFISTEQIISQAESLGFKVIKTHQAKVKKIERLGYQRHGVVLSHDKWMLANGDRLQLLVVNSHDGTGSLRLTLGYFRLVCANGLVVSDTKYERRVRHSRNAMQNLQLALADLFGLAYDIVSKIDHFRSIQLTPEQIREFTRHMLEAKTNDFQTVDPVKANRFEDLGTDLWTVFNRTQEQIVNGGLYLVDKDGKFKKLRAVSSIKTQIELNQKLWAVAEKWAA